MSYLGKVYKHVGHENFDSFLKSVGMPDDRIQAYLNSSPTSKLELKGDTYVFTQTGADGPKETSFKSGVEFTDTVFGNDKLNTSYTVDGNTVTQVVKGDKGTATFKREYNGDDLVVTITADTFDGVARRFYKA